MSKQRKSATFRHLSLVTHGGGVVVPPQVSAPKTTLLRALEILVVPTLSAPCALRGLGAPVRMGAPLGGRPARPRGFGAASLPPLGYRAPAPPRGRSACRGVALRGRGFGFESGSLGNLDTTSNPAADALCDRVRVSGISTVAPLPLMACGP